jgi:hypothetical protein
MSVEFCSGSKDLQIGSATNAPAELSASQLPLTAASGRSMSKRRTIILTLCTCLGLMLIVGSAFAQMQISPAPTTESLVKDVLIGKGIKVKDVRFTGMPEAVASFSNPAAKPFATGIVISTGKARDLAGPNENPKSSTVNGSPGDKNLYVLAGGRTFDAALLDFDFMADKDSVTFNFVFASEEYNEFVGSTFNDAFALVVTGPGMPAGKNFGLIPGTNKPITVNSVNANENRDLYIDNNPFTLVGRINEQAKAKIDPAQLRDVGYDGMTKVLTVGFQVTPRAAYHMQIAIADAGDGTVDSAILLEGGSFKSQEQYRHVLRRAQIAEQRRQDSLARAIVIADSLQKIRTADSLVAVHREDSIAAAKALLDARLKKALEEKSAIDTLQSDDDSDLKDMGDDDLDDDENEEEEGEEVPEIDPRLQRLEIKEIIQYPLGEYLVPDSMEAKLQVMGKMLAARKSLRIGIYVPDGNSPDIAKLRYDMIRLELIKAGAKPEQLFPNGFSFQLPDTNRSANRAEIWLRDGE